MRDVGRPYISGSYATGSAHWLETNAHESARLVLDAIAEGHATREAIQLRTGFTQDVVSNVLADLSLLQGLVTSKAVDGERLFTLKVAA